MNELVTLARPLRLDVRRQWTPQIWSHRPTVEEVGIEDLALEFPDVQYPGHHKEQGYHAIYLDRAFHCWVRNVSITQWNIRAAKSRFPSRIPTLAGGEPRLPQINIVGVAGWQTRKTNDAEWIESWPGQVTQPPNLYEAPCSHCRAFTP